MIEVLSWHTQTPDTLTAGQHQGEPVTMIEVLSWPPPPGTLTGGIEALTVARTKANP